MSKQDKDLIEQVSYSSDSLAIYNARRQLWEYRTAALQQIRLAEQARVEDQIEMKNNQKKLTTRLDI